MKTERTQVALPQQTFQRKLTTRLITYKLQNEEEHCSHIFKNSFMALKPGGSFGVVEHRAKPGTGLEAMKSSGYVTESHAIEVALKHGFELVEKSEINANPKDTKDHPKGVWTLPPSLRLDNVDREKYESIGESDRMTLLFRMSFCYCLYL